MKSLIIAGVLVGILAIGLLLKTSDNEATINEEEVVQTEITAEQVSLIGLPEREGPLRETTGSVPHVQIGAELVPEFDAELRRRVFQLPGIENRESDRSLPGARGLSFVEGFQLDRPDVIEGSSEFAHIHPDGSLHVWLPVTIAKEVDAMKWGELHPWVNQVGFWDGVVMVFTPESLADVDETIKIIVEAYNFITGANIEPDDIS